MLRLINVIFKNAHLQTYNSNKLQYCNLEKNVKFDFHKNAIQPKKLHAAKHCKKNWKNEFFHLGKDLVDLI